MNINSKLKANLNFKDKYLSKFATKNSDAMYLYEDKKDIRPSFFKDVDRIIYSLSYTRYIDKTQVFSLNDNDNISKRIIHVQLVSKIARTIGRALNLNEDLIEAASLGHDLGHVPFGHIGESILNEISLENNEGYFNHNIQSVRNLMVIENKNITLQTLDAIMCHNGEFILGKYYPVKKNVQIFFDEYQKSYKNKNFIKTLKPMTLEGCIVRISDMIGYLGRDIEDAIRLNLLKVEDIPKEITNILGSNNSQIINTIVLDIIKNSFAKPYIKLSPKIYNAIKSLKDFNYKNIYNKANSKKDILYYKNIFRKLFQKFLEDLNEKNTESDIYNLFIMTMPEKYLQNNSNARIVIDYLAGMTDDFIIKEYNKYIK